MEDVHIWHNDCILYVDDKKSSVHKVQSQKYLKYVCITCNVFSVQTHFLFLLTKFDLGGSYFEQ